MFHSRFNCFLRDVLLSPARPLREIADYFFRVEFQQRGSPHIHCLLWVKDEPKIGKDLDDVVIDFIDKYVTCSIPDKSNELCSTVQTVQQHSKRHTKSCRKKGTTLGFNFPRNPSLNTFISHVEHSNIEEGDIKMANNVLKSVARYIAEPQYASSSLQDMFQQLNITQNLFENACCMLTQKTSIVLKRNMQDVWTNPYNPTLLGAWDANIDIQ